MNSKCIVFVIFTLQGNGAERVVLTLASSMRRLGYNTHIILFKNHIDFQVDPNLPIHFFPYHKFRVLPRAIRPYFASKAFDKFVYNLVGKPNLILSNLEPVDRVLTNSKLDNIHFVIHTILSSEHSSDLKRLNKTLKIYTKKSCISVSKGVHDDLISLLPKNKNMEVIYNPIDIDFIKSSSEAVQIIPHKHRDYIINVGGFKSHKRQDLLLKAFAKSNIKENLMFIGKGPLLDATRQLSIELGIADRVIFAGFKSNPFPFIKHAKALVSSSDFEGLGMTILEAISLGVPVISTNCPSGPSEILPPLNLSPVGDIEELAKNIKNVVKYPNKYLVKLKKDFLLEASINSYFSLLGKEHP